MTRTKTEFKPLIMADVEEVEVVVAHNERATLRVGDVFLKIDADQSRTDVEVEAVAMAPIPTTEVLWRKPPVLALAALPGTVLGRLGEPSTASSAAWAAAGGLSLDFGETQSRGKVAQGCGRVQASPGALAISDSPKVRDSH